MMGVMKFVNKEQTAKVLTKQDIVDAFDEIRNASWGPFPRPRRRKDIAAPACNAIDPAPDTSSGTLGGNTNVRRIKRDEGM